MSFHASTLDGSGAKDHDEGTDKSNDEPATGYVHPPARGIVYPIQDIQGVSYYADCREAT